MKTKKCTGCGKVKKLSEFNKQKLGKFGKRADCKKCQKEYYEENKEKDKERGKLYRDQNKKKLSKQQKQWCDNNKERKKKINKKWRLKNKVKIKKKSKQYRDNNKEKLKKVKSEFYIKNKDQIVKKQKNYRDKNKQKWNLYLKNKRDNDLNYKLATILRSRLRHALNGKLKIQSTLELLGCSVKQLKIYLESQFVDGMSWDNYGLYGWHIDHKRPCASFDLSKPSEQRKCFHFSNLQPLWAIDNLKKSDKLNHEREFKTV